MISYKKGGIRFNYRIAGVTIHNNRVLLHRQSQDDFWALPGGRCELLENSRDTLVREYREEIGAEVRIGRTLFFVENFFRYKGEDFHEISPRLEVQFPPDSPFLSIEEFQGREENEVLVFKWFDLPALRDISLYPTFLTKEILNLEEGSPMKHIVHTDDARR